MFFFCTTKYRTRSQCPRGSRNRRKVKERQKFPLNRFVPATNFFVLRCRITYIDMRKRRNRDRKRDRESRSFLSLLCHHILLSFRFYFSFFLSFFSFTFLSLTLCCPLCLFRFLFLLLPFATADCMINLCCGWAPFSKQNSHIALRLFRAASSHSVIIEGSSNCTSDDDEAFAK